MNHKRRRAEIIEIWAEKVRNRDITWARVARDNDIDYKWLMAFVNEGRIADQVIKVKKLDRYFQTADLDHDKYVSEKINRIEDEELFK